MINITHDGSFDLALGKSRKETNWQNKEWKWSRFLKEIKNTHRTKETHKQYMSAKKDRQGEIKDIGGYVGGHMTQGRRQSGSVSHRQLITLDIDYGNPDTWTDFLMCFPVAAAIYTTHKHAPEHPKYRLLIPLDRPVACDEYQAIARKIAGIVDIELFDHTTFEPERLMYWPSSSKDSEYFTDFNDDEWISADKILSMYPDWTDSSQWPVSAAHSARIRKDILKQEEPTEKKGIIGAFCRTYTITEAIDTFLTEMYDSCDIQDRYTYKHGSTSAGLVVYDDKFAFSHHGTDPTAGNLCNAFDLVRIHLFGLQDEDCSAETKITSRPSYLSMMDWARKDDTVKIQIGNDRMAQAREDFDFSGDDDTEDWLEDDLEDLVGPAPDDDKWLAKMEVDDKNKYTSTINNVIIALNNDPNLKNKFGFNQFEQRETVHGRLPWHRKGEAFDQYISDTDDAGLRHYVERVYGISNMQKVKDALDLVVHSSAYHPVKKYLNKLQWDGKGRVEDLLVNFMGADDTEYTHAVTRKMMAAAVARIYRPGVKFDYVLTLVGPEGKGKSELFSKLFGQWFSDSFSGVHGKESFEQLQGVWGVEVPELAGMKKADADAVKHYIAKKVDRYRVAYGKRTENFPRQCIFVGTTNEMEFLVSHNGNRRFWPVVVHVNDPLYSVFTELDKYTIDQLWAEAVQIFKQGEKLFLSADMEKLAFEAQTEHTIKDDRAGVISKFLDRLLPNDWEERDIYGRQEFINSEIGDSMQPKGVKQRTKVVIGEVWCECLGGKPKDMTNYNTRDLHAIMRKLPGWEPHKSKIKSSIYGVQRGYRRINGNQDNFEEFI